MRVRAHLNPKLYYPPRIILVYFSIHFHFCIFFHSFSFACTFFKAWLLSILGPLRRFYELQKNRNSNCMTARRFSHGFSFSEKKYTERPDGVMTRPFYFNLDSEREMA